MRRLLLLFLILALLVIIPFLIWGEPFESWFEFEAFVEKLRRTGPWAGVVGVALLWADLFLPVLGTTVMSALGLIYGILWGGLLASLGSIGAGLIAYGLCRGCGRRAAIWIAGEDGLARGERLFAGRSGGWLIALSRWMPVLPEAIACLAGLSRMPFRKFALSLCAGCLPLSFTFAWIGSRGETDPGWALLVSVGLPPVIWAVVQGAMHWLNRRK
ncbi:MAG: VTT domain-containing protein [Verrucomicrobiota bacterium]